MNVEATFPQEMSVAMAPPREDKTDASRLSFPLPMVFAIVGTAISVAGAQYVAQAGLRSDVRDILTRMEMQTKVDAEATKLKDERFEQIRKEVDSLTREDRLRQYDLKTINDRVDAVEKKR